MRVRPRILVLLCAALAAPGCSSQEATTPAACLDLDGGDSVRAALRAAPAEVRLDGRPLSSCLHEGSDGAALQSVGQAYLEAASALAGEAADRPGGAAATELGYLVGATRRGAARSQGVADELLRRLEQEVARVGEGSRAFREGERAGRRGG